VRIIGGHTIDDFPPKYGLAVTGFVHPARVITNAGARPGDRLVLTKPVGTGIISAGLRLGMTSDGDVRAALSQMKLLNKTGAEIMKKYNVRGATDVTGFGLAGHALKMARASNVTITLKMRSVPLTGNTYRLTDEGCIPGASFRNLEYAESTMETAEDLDYNLKMIAFDAQTSGGLLMSVPEEKLDLLLSDLHSAGLVISAMIGSVAEKTGAFLRLEN
jgi:selenide, water dikinase